LPELEQIDDLKQSDAAVHRSVPLCPSGKNGKAKSHTESTAKKESGEQADLTGRETEPCPPLKPGPYVKLQSEDILKRETDVSKKRFTAEQIFRKLREGEKMISTWKTVAHITGKLVSTW
jgi:hypothetical protein